MHTHHHQFRAFAHVVKQGSFSRAARKLSVSQSAITQHVSNLERRVGTRLLVRARDGVELTQAGREFFDLADRFVSLEAIIEERLEGYADFSSGQLTVIANAPQPALGIIAAYGSLYPEIEVDFALFDWTSAMAMMQSNRADVGIITAPSETPDLWIEPLTEARYVLYCRQDHRLAQRSEVSLSDLRDEVLLLPERGSLTQRVVTAALKAHGVSPRRTQKTATFPVMKEAILQGVGVGIFLDCSATEEERLAEVAIIELPERFETCCVAQRHKLDLRLVQSFTDVALEQR